MISLLLLIRSLILWILRFSKRRNMILLNLWRLLLTVSIFSFLRFLRFVEFFEKNFRVLDLSSYLINRKFSFLFLCILFVVFKSNRRFQIRLRSRCFLIFFCWFVFQSEFVFERFWWFFFLYFVFERKSQFFFWLSISQSNRWEGKWEDNLFPFHM